MARLEQSGTHETHHSRNPFLSFKSLNIRDKIVLPFLVLTLVIAIIGVYVVTRLVAGSLDERLTNQLLEAGRVVSDNLARREINHLEWARIVAYTRGLDEALVTHNPDKLVELAQPAATSLGLECLVVVDVQAKEALHLLKQDDAYTVVTDSSDIASSWIVESLLEARNIDSPPKRALGRHPVDQRYYYFSAIPIGLQDQVIGVVVVGSSLDGLLSRFKVNSLADIVVYLDDGQAIATTFAFQSQAAEVQKLLADLAIRSEEYQASLNSTELTVIEGKRVSERDYRLARGPLRVGSNTLGVFAVALPSNYITQADATSRNTYSTLFAIAMGCVIFIGYIISRLITRPLSTLVRTSQAIAEGDLDRRTGIDSKDEIGVLATTFDQMTERLAQRTQDLNQSLQVQEETAGRLQSVLSSIGDGVMLGDLEGSFIPMNAAARAILEDMASNFQLASLHELTTADPSQASGPTPDMPPVERRRFQAGNRVVNTHAAPVRTDDGECIGTVVVLQDMTAEVAAEQLKDAFVAHVSHELRTPLTAIKGFSELLYATTNQVLDNQQRTFLQTIGRNTDSLMEMVNGLLDFSEMEAKGRLGLQRRPMSLGGLLEDIADEWQSRMADRKLTLQLDIAPDVPRVEIDEKRLRWAIINLVRNAWQYTPVGGQVSLNLSARDGHVVLDVIDTGVGISEQEQKHLFTRFYRGAIKLEEEMRGLGLGLYVTKAIIEAHGGTIQFSSRQGVGTTFSVTLPARMPEQGQPAKSAQVSEPK